MFIQSININNSWQLVIQMQDVTLKMASVSFLYIRSISVRKLAFQVSLWSLSVTCRSGKVSDIKSEMSHIGGIWSWEVTCYTSMLCWHLSAWGLGESNVAVCQEAGSRVQEEPGDAWSTGDLHLHNVMECCHNSRKMSWEVEEGI